MKVNEMGTAAYEHCDVDCSLMAVVRESIVSLLARHAPYRDSALCCRMVVSMMPERGRGEGEVEEKGEEGRGVGLIQDGGVPDRMDKDLRRPLRWIRNRTWPDDKAKEC